MDRVARQRLTMPKNWKGDPLRFFNIHSVAKHEKIEEKIFFIFGIKSHNAEKNWKEEPFGIFQHPFCRKTSKKMQGGPFEEKKFRKKNPKKMSRSAEKNWKGGLFGLARYDMLRGKTGKTILVQFARPNGAIWHHNNL